MNPGVEGRTHRTRSLSPRVATALAAVAALTFGCAEPTAAPRSPTALNRSQSERRDGNEGKSELTSAFGAVLAVISDAQGMPLTKASPPGTLVFGHPPASPPGAPNSAILLPNGHQMTLGEYIRPSGKVSLECGARGTEAEVKLKGLVPNGVYTFWLLTFKAPGFDPTFANLIGLGALGSNIGAGNSFTASANGKGELESVVPAGTLSIFGKVGSCVLSEFEVHVIAGYHYPYPVAPQALWPDPGPDEKFIEQAAAVFNP